MPKGLGLLSGGVDSILACLILRQTGIEIEAITYKSPFFEIEHARRAAGAYSIPLTILEIGAEHLEQVVKNPHYGYGSNMNPCIDCHAYMLRKAGLIMDKRGFDFLFTGEVLGQRPMSQNRQALDIVAKASGYEKQILRPLSARVLPMTIMEEKGIVDRECLLALSGRSRKAQIALAKELGVRDYPPPAGGCLLTESSFSRRLKDLFLYSPDVGIDEVKYLKYGRHLRLSARAKVVIGRNYFENQILLNLAPKVGWPMLSVGFKGPIGIYFGSLEDPAIFIAGSTIAGYCRIPLDNLVEIKVKDGPLLFVIPFSREKINSFLI